MPPPPQANGGKVTPNLAMDAEATRMLNLTVLQRLDPAVEDILITAAHVTLYDFNIDLNQWSRKDVEGSLFVVKRYVAGIWEWGVLVFPLVVHRVCGLIASLDAVFLTDNLVEDLLSDFEYELQPPYLLYRNAAQEYLVMCNSEFEELEAVPTSAAIDGPLEPPPSSSALVSDAPDESLANYLNGATNIGSVSSAQMDGRVHPSTEAVACAHVPLVVPSATPAHQMSHPLGASSAPPLPLHDANAHASHSANLLTPAFFAPPSPSSTSVAPAPPAASMMPTAPPLHPTSASAQRPPYGTPLLQPFPPPNPPPSLTPAHNDGTVISRDKVKDALQRLVQSDEFIDLILRELQNAHM
ncbi:hypothetical protein HU200_030263 [Digitaria exilis]|uniref:mRNA-decapping enzyme-like protein n=1 Tax=Digitaria exilis TaxID=1010633 RepID=A0A835C0J9_9POAL|nr:hypothetical protein HU200_030263 [Digitaria exilis]